MYRKTIWIILCCVVVGLAGVWTARTFGNSYSYNNQRIPRDQNVILPQEDMRIAAGKYSLSGPYSYNNLMIFLIHGQDQSKAKPTLTLSEAMQQKKVIVHETEDVNELSIENTSNDEVFVQAGDIVKGGKQDRVLALDMIVPRKSGKIPIDSFCVEQGRWSNRGEESVAAFSESSKMLSSKDLKIAAKSSRSQSEVWDKVAIARGKIAEGVVAADPMTTPPPLPQSAGIAGGNSGDSANAPSQATAVDFSLRGMLSSSLQLGLEDDRLENVVGDYVEKLKTIIDGKKDVIGYAFAINGELNSADIYTSNDLFVRQWPKLLESSATEAISEFDSKDSKKKIEANAVADLLSKSEIGKPEVLEVSKGAIMIKRESDNHLFFEMRRSRKPADWVHRNYIVK